MSDIGARHSSEELQFDHSRGSLVFASQALESSLEVQQVDHRITRTLDSSERNALPATPSLARSVASRVIEKDSSHRSGRDRKEVRALLPHHSFLIHETKVRLVDQSGGLERVIRPLSSEEPECQATKLYIYGLGELVRQLSSGLLTQFVKESRDVLPWIHARAS